MPLRWLTQSIPLAAGLNNKVDARALEPPALLTCKNGVFTEAGGIQLRYPYTALSTSILGTGTISNIRRIAAYGDELLAFTRDSLYTWSVRDLKWVLRGTYLAPKVTERPVFARSGSQLHCCRAELSSVIFYAWMEKSASDDIYVAATDKTTGATLLAPTAVATSGKGRPRLVALANKVLLFAKTGSTTLSVKALDPTNIATSVAVAFTNVTTSEYDEYYDVTPLTSTSVVVVWRRTTKTSYAYATVNEALTVTASTKARPCSGPIAVAVTAAGANVAVVRDDSGDIEGDILTSAFVDVAVNAAVGTISGGAAQIGVGFRSTQNSSQFRCYAFYSNAAVPSTGGNTRYNYVDTAGNVGTDAVFVLNARVASRGFDDGNGRVFVWMHAGENDEGNASYFLYRDDALLCAKAVMNTAGTNGADSAGYVSGVQNTATNTWSFAGVTKRIIPSSTADYYSDGDPVDVTVELDSNDARRSAQIGRTLFIAGGQVVQYDGEGIAELGFHIYPSNMAVTDVAAGSLAAGTYSWLHTYAWQNAKAELDRSTTDTIISTAIGASREAALSLQPLTVTLKQGARAAPNIEVWRTAANAATTADFHLVTSKDPAAAGTTDNGYIVNSATLGYITGKRDDMADAIATTKEAYPENGDVLENIAPPAATIITANHERLFLAGIAGDPYAVWPSKLRLDDSVPSFHESLVVRLPATGGDITALAFLSNMLVVFKETAIYALPGDGFDNTGGGQNFGPPQLIANDIGARSADVVATTPAGLFFLSGKGWYLLDRGLTPQYIGGPVEDFNSDTFTAVHVLEGQHQVRCLSTARVLMFDYLQSQWAEWEVVGVHAALYNGTYHYCTASGVFSEATSYASIDYSLKVRLAWMKANGLLGCERFRGVAILGEYRSAHDLKLEFFRDYNETAFQTKTWTVSPTTVGGGEIVRHGLSIQKMAALSLQITTRAVGTDTAPTGEACKLTGITLEYGVKKGLHRLPAAQKQ